MLQSKSAMDGALGICMEKAISLIIQNAPMIRQVSPVVTTYV